MQVFILELKKRLIGALAIEQAAYQPGHSIIEQIQTIQQIIEKLINSNNIVLFVLLIIQIHLIQSNHPI